MNNKNSIFKVIVDGLLYLFVFTVPLSQWVSIKILIASFVISFFVKQLYTSKGFVLKSIGAVFYLFVLITGISYSEDTYNALHVLETNFSFFAIPIVFLAIENLNEDKLLTICFYFTTGLLASCVICIGNAAVQYYATGDSLVFFFYDFTNILGFQPTYLAYYLIFVITIGLYLLYYQRGKVSSTIIFALMLFFFLILMLTGGRTTFIGLLFVFSFFVLKFLVEEKSQFKLIVFGLICIMITCMFYVSQNGQSNRDVVLDDSWERFVLWEAAIKAIPNILWGVGTGDHEIILNEYYLTHGLAEYVTDSYNSHNQFIQILFTNGILGLIAVLFLIGRPIFLSIRNQDVLGILVFFPFLMYGMTEVFLGRFQGVVFFALLHQVFVCYYTSLKPGAASLKGE